MKTFKLDGEIKIADYEWRDYNLRYIFFNEFGEQFVLCIDTDQRCCENFEVLCNLPKVENGITISNYGIVITVGDENEIDVSKIFKEENCDYDEDDEYYPHSVVIKISVRNVPDYEEGFEEIDDEENNIYFKISNEHNGYYAHFVELNKNGDLVWSDEI